jgi:GH24 family phage-related lysozyme (muramidase)
MLNTATYLPQLKIFEGSIPFMYVDTTGNVTVGVGNLLANAAAAQNLTFQRRPDPAAAPPVAVARPATAAEILADFNNVARQMPGQAAGFYRQFTKLDMPETAIDALLQTRVTEFLKGLTAAFPAIDALLQTRVTEFLKGLTAAFPDFNGYPDAACAALFDMAFNLGLTKLTGDFPKFCAAVKKKDWATASAQCHRNGIGPSRNAWTKAQFDQATTDAKSKAATT